jgi:hypothetical protein
MDWNNVLQTLLTYGKGPIIRGIAWAAAALLGKYGVTQAIAGDFANGLWPNIAGGVLAIGALISSIQSAKKLHEADPPK